MDYTVKAKDWDQGFPSSDWSKPDFSPVHDQRNVIRLENVVLQLQQKLMILICGINMPVCKSKDIIQYFHSHDIKIFVGRHGDCKHCAYCCLQLLALRK